MADDNKQILLEANKAISQGDYEGFLEYCTENTEWTFVGDQTLHGKDEVRQWMKNTYIEPPRFSVEKMVEEANIVIAIGKIAIRLEDGKMAHSEYCDVWEFRNGKMATLKAYVVDTKKLEK